MNAYEVLKRKYDKIKLLDTVKICCTLVNGRRTTIMTNTEHARHYNIKKGNYWQRVEVTHKNKTFEKWALVHQI